LLLRSRGAGWSEADVPLLDELATLLGPPPQSAAERAARRRRAEEERERQAFAADSLTSFGLVGHLSAEELAARLAEGPATWALVDHGLTDREWSFGHVVIDEAQELSEMAWRMVFRRCPARSMTLVGDLNQTGSPAGVSDWSVLLDRHARGRWRRARLTVNYRTPRPIAEAAAQLLRARGADVEQPESVRDGDPVQVVKADDLAGQLDALVREALRSTNGTVAVLVRPDMAVPVESHDRLSVLSAKDAKGLEFDHVLVVEPAGFLESPCGAQDLYVGLTRATRKLTIVHTRELPPGLWLPAMGAACEGAP
jgi:superfamily I DNA/RNA helicase